MACINCNNQDCEDCINRKVRPLFQPSTMHLHLPMTISAVREHIRLQRHLPPERRVPTKANGLGFLPAVGAAGGAASGAQVGAYAGPIGAAIGAAVGVISSLIGGAAQRGRDEEASGVALQQSVDGIYALKEAVQRGELTVDQARQVFRTQLLNAFLLFVATLKTESVRDSRSTNQKRDLENLFEKEVGSLTGFLPSRPTGASGSQPLPGYCPGGTYHPIDDPFSCVPYPANAADLAAQAIGQGAQDARRLADQLRAQQSRQAALARAQQQAAMPCPSGQQRNPATGKCVEIGACPPGTYPDAAIGQCVILPQCVDSLVDIETGRCVEPSADGLGGVPSWLWLLLIALVLASSAGGDGERYSRRRR